MTTLRVGTSADARLAAARAEWRSTRYECSLIASAESRATKRQARRRYVAALVRYVRDLRRRR